MADDEKTPLGKAIRFAERKHAGQKYGDRPYTSHLASTAMHLWEAMIEAKTPAEEFSRHMCAAYLHDVLEDTDAILDELYEVADEDVITVVETLTGTLGRNRQERIDEVYKQFGLLKGVRPDLYVVAQRVKLADRLANVSFSQRQEEGLFRMYRKEHEALVSGIGASKEDAVSALLLDEINTRFLEGYRGPR